MTESASACMLPIAMIGELADADYVGLIDGDAVELLKVRMAADGLLTPIWVRRNGNAASQRWSVIAGRHRLRAALALGWTEIETIEKAGPASAGDDLRRLQLVENLDRRVLRPIERARFLMERWREAASSIAPSTPRNQQAEAVRQRWSVWEVVSQTPAGDVRMIDEATAATCGLTDRTIRSYRKIHTAIIGELPDLFAQINAHPLGESLSAMTRLATLNDVARPKAAAMILSRADWQSMDEVLSAAGLMRSTGSRVDQGRPDAVILDAWNKLQPSGRRAHVEWLAAKVTPSLAQHMIAVLKKRALL